MVDTSTFRASLDSGFTQGCETLNAKTVHQAPPLVPPSPEEYLQFGKRAGSRGVSGH